MPALLTTLAALFAVALSASAQAAPLTAHIKEVVTTDTGCEPKGLGGFALGQTLSGAPLPAGVYRYVVAVTTPAGLVPCKAIVVPVPTSNNSVLLQWRNTTTASAGTDYRVYRAFNAGNFQRVVAPAPDCSNPTRCYFTDVANIAVNPLDTPPAQIADDTRAGAHTDVRFRQTIDYGDADGDRDSDTTDPITGFLNDPFTPMTTQIGANEALRTDLFHFPPGLISNPNATAGATGGQYCEEVGPSSFLGDPDVQGVQDTNEDKCPRSTFLGTVQTITRVPSGPPANPFASSRLSMSFGDIYNARPRAGEPGRLFAVIRPACSGDYAFPALRPGGAQCNGLVGPNREVEKEFLTAVANIVERPDGNYAIDVENFDFADQTDGELKPYQQILVPNNQAGDDNAGNDNDDGTLERRANARIPRQVRQITQTLIGAAYNDTPTDTSDDRPFMTLPTSCGPKTLSATKTSFDDVGGDTSDETGQFTTTECGTVPFNPALDAGPDTRAETPVPHHDTISFPSDTDVQGRHQSHIEDVTAQFPPGLNLSAGAGNFVTAEGVQIGDVTGNSDELGLLNGPVNLKRVNPDGTFVIEAEVKQRNPLPGPDTRSLVKIVLTATVFPDPATGQLRAEFDRLPEVPFTSLQLEFQDGQTIPLVAPPTCGLNEDHLQFTPWSGNPNESRDDSWTTTDCPSVPRPFEPTISTSLSTTQAASGSQLSVHLAKPDRNQNLEGFDLTLPSGLVTKLSDFTQCPSAQAQAGTCADSSQLGTVAIEAGNGSPTLTLPGKVFLTEPAAGTDDLAGLVVVVPAKVGPFDLGTVITRSRIKFDTARLGVATTTIDPLPTILKGIPVRVRSIDLVLNGMRNPSSCDADQFTATLRSQGDPTTTATAAEGGLSRSVASAFQATGCDQLPFGPKLAVSATNEAGDHPSVKSVVSQADGEAPQRSAKVTMPAGLGPNPAVLQNLCSPDQLAGNACPANTQVGTAKAVSDLLPAPLTGPVYVVQRPGETLPKVVAQLKGLISLNVEGVVSLADGGRLATSFTGLPNTPVRSFELDLFGGNAANGTPLFTAKNELCNGNQRADGEFSSYTGKSATDSALVAVSGACPPPVAGTVNSRNTGQATVSMLIKRVKSGRPTMVMKVTRSKTSANLRRVQLTLPKGLRFHRKPSAAALRAVSVRTAGGKRVPRSAWRILSKNRLVVNATAGSPVVAINIRRGIITSRKTLRSRKALRKRLSFKVAVTDVQDERYSITKKVKPLS